MMTVTGTSHKRLDIWNCCQLNCVQQRVQAHHKENIKALQYWTLGFCSQRINDVETVFMSWTLQLNLEITFITFFNCCNFHMYTLWLCDAWAQVCGWQPFTRKAGSWESDEALLGTAPWEAGRRYVEGYGCTMTLLHSSFMIDTLFLFNGF